MLNKSFLLILIVMLTQSCRKNSEKNLLEKKVFSTVDSMSSSFPKEYPVNLFTVTHQRLKNKDYIKISTAEFFNKDSVSSIKFNNQKLIVYYSKNFFEQKQESLGSYKDFEYTSNTISLYHSRYVVFEVLRDNIYRNIPLEKSIEMKLFDFGDRYIPEPAPTK
ncbi:hypothetical protein IW15_22085 [Chryseobacterium soli]|uniref:Uncharacterized protein n=1 Tax=Chryseobacterium soli TaxID=445961 RepID=A0A085ZZJ5_9FLAO|nr:hypothetical protein [Chryseobacterium soli]KFF09859.1 hypothetical protein IW15_22085 [Chryseobacterium soli]